MDNKNCEKYLLELLGYDNVEELRADLKSAGEVRKCRQTWKGWAIDTAKDIVKIAVITGLGSLGYAVLRGYGI